MNNISLKETHHSGSKVRSEELRQEAILRLAEEVGLLLRQPEREQLHWRASRLDLMEALYEVFLVQGVRDEQGRPLTFMQLVRATCRVLHMDVPRNPYDCAARGRRRKGLISQPYLDRYQYLLQVTGNKEPLWEDIR
jgi:hypothetical protein